MIEKCSKLANEDERSPVMMRLTEICDWLKTHSIVAEPKFAPLAKGNDAYQLNAAIKTLDADIVVAGAYGHSRLRKWAFGGVTRNLSLQAKHYTLLSH